MMLDTCAFGLNSGRVDNVCKAKLDSIALRLQSESDASLVIVGSAASTERNAQQLSQTRADNVRAYLARDKGIAESRLTSRTGAAGTGVAARKAEMTLVPRGATFMGYNKQLDIERSRSVEAAAPQLPSTASPVQAVRTGNAADSAAGDAVRSTTAKPVVNRSANAPPAASGGKRIIASLR
jgi:hypothetical protein